jgi:putative flippase GtrA
MVFSFFANQRYVFQASGGNFWAQAASFYLVTAFGLYVIQNIAIHLITKRLDWLRRLILAVAGVFGLRKRLSDDFIVKNSAKLAATAFSLVWNFVMFQLVVFHP